MIERGGGWLPWRGAFAATAGGAAAILLTIAAAAAADTAVRLVNPSNVDALVRLVGRTNKTVWVRSGETRELPAEAGDYTLLVRYGTDPDRFSYTRSEPFRIDFNRPPPQATVTLPPVRPLDRTAAGEAGAPPAAPSAAPPRPPEDRAALERHRPMRLSASRRLPRIRRCLPGSSADISPICRRRLR